MGLWSDLGSFFVGGVTFEPPPAIGGPVRADAATQGTPGSSSWNALTGLGSPNADPASSVMPVRRRSLTEWELDTLYRQWPLARRVVDVYAEWAVGQGWRVDGTAKRDIATTADEDLSTRAAFYDLVRLARKNGWAILVPTVIDGTDDWSQPLNPATVRAVTGLKVYTRPEAVWTDWDVDPDSDGCGYPSMWQITPSMGGTSINVHASRVVYLGGVPLSWHEREGGLDGSVLDLYWSALSHRTSFEQSAATIVNRADAITLAIKNLAGRGGGASGLQFRSYMQDFARRVGMIGIGVHDADDVVSRHGASLSGLEHVDATTRREVSGVEGIAQSVIWTDQPGGLANDGQQSRKFFAGNVAAYQELRLAKQIRRFYGIIGAAYGISMDGARIHFEAIEPMTPAEEGAIKLVNAQTDAIYNTMGALGTEEIRQARHGGPEYGWDIRVEGEAPDDLVMALLAERPPPGAEAADEGEE